MQLDQILGDLEGKNVEYFVDKYLYDKRGQ